MAYHPQLCVILLALSTLAICVKPPPIVEIIPALQSTADSFALFTAESYGLDAPSVQPINASAYEWWYFDTVSDDGKYSVVFTFYTSSDTGFPGGGTNDSIVPVTITVGTPQDSYYFYKRSSAKEAVVTSIGNGASGDWVGTGFYFKGKSDLSEYVITVDSPDKDVNGSVQFKAVSPAHYPCGPAQAGVNMEAMPHLGWAVAISDSIAEVDLMVNGTSVKFTGVGYHDKNWGDIPFATVLKSSIWGHGRLGPYSIVWTVTTERSTGNQYSAGYLARDGKVITFGCSQISVTPTSNAANYYLEIDLGHQGVFAFDTKEVALIDGTDPTYGRFTGLLSGGIKGEKQYSGIGLYEHFAL